jgi:hypothetical protein
MQSETPIEAQHMNEVAKRDSVPPTSLILEGDPEAQLQYAERAAKALMRRIEAKPKKVLISGKQYLEFGDWQTLSRFFGGTVSTEWVKAIERDGELAGYEARSVVLQHGRTISAAEASCFRSEKNWAKRDEFALKSMAQTRAGSKAMRNAFGWVAELANLPSTPAEEMEDYEDDRPPPKQSTRSGSGSKGPEISSKIESQGERPPALRLAEAAELGTKALQKVWQTLSYEDQVNNETLKETRYKPRAIEVDAMIEDNA